MPDDEGKVQVVVKDETLWCTQKAMAQLFGVGVPAISKHLKNIFDEGELNKKVVVSKMEITTQHGAMADKSQTHSVDFYHLDAIIAVGYRVNSAKGNEVPYLPPLPDFARQRKDIGSASKRESGSGIRHFQPHPAHRL